MRKIRGKVKLFEPKKKWGFITGEDGVDYFFHETDKARNIDIQPNDEVIFLPVSCFKGPKAVCVDFAGG